jgi:hypothetical protein
MRLNLYRIFHAFSVKWPLGYRTAGGSERVTGDDGGEVSTVSGSDRVPSWASVVVKVRQLVALPIKHVVNCARHAALIPKVSFASLFRPWAVIVSPTTIPPHLPGGVCLEGKESAFRLY